MRCLSTVRRALRVLTLTGCALLAAWPVASRATETENHFLPVLPAPGKVSVDGKLAGWDLSGGVFACGEAEHLRDQYAVWIHAMYDNDNLYLLARWQDPTPLNNPENLGGHGFNGDCLQVRFILFPDTPAQKTVSWWDFWRDARGVPVIERSWPGATNGVPDNPLPAVADLTQAGVQQAFAVAADGKGYVQEVAIPWRLLSVAGLAPAVGEKFRVTVEPNFTAGSFGRITIKDLFDPAVKAPDRIFTFRAYAHWGFAALQAKGQVEPPPVRLADGRTFPVHLVDGQPVVDWTGLIRRFEWPGFKPLTFTMPLDGYVSLDLVGADGVVARHLLNWDARSKGPVTVQWDGLSDATYRTPGTPLPAGEYTWQALAHPGAKLTYRGSASGGGRVPWQAAPGDFWLGDHGVPSAVVTDGERLYLACNGAEGGRHLIATDFSGTLIWGLQNTTGAADPESIAVADGAVYVLHPKVHWTRGAGIITRVDAKSGAYLPWPGTKSHILSLASIWPAGVAGMDHFDAIAARGGHLYLGRSSAAFFVEDVTDWKALITALRGDTPLAKRLLAKVNPATTTRLSDFLAGKNTQEQAFATYNGGPRFDSEVVAALNDYLSDDTAAPPAPADAAGPALAKRRVLEQTFATMLKPLPAEGLVVLDIATGKVTQRWPLLPVDALAAVNEHQLDVVVGGTQVLAVDPATGTAKALVTGLQAARGITVDADGSLFVSDNGTQMQVLHYDAQGKLLGRIGRPGGRAQLGAWQADGLLFPAGIAVDKAHHLWVMEHDAHPKRVSVWNLADGTLSKDIFGPTHYGASGSAINPRDPNLMVGVGCEWRLAPATGTAVCLGAFDRQYHQFATYREGSNGKLYLYTVFGQYGTGGVQVWERLGDAQYALRAELRNDQGARPGPGQTDLWVDANGDGVRQPEELQSRPGMLFITGSNDWSLNLGPDLTLYAQDGKDQQLKALPAAGFTAGGAPRYDLTKLQPLPAAFSVGYERNYSCALPSADNKTILLNLRAKDHPAGYLWTAFDLATGALKWTYPNPYFQVHGSHLAPAPDPGLFRGAYGPVGAVAFKGAAGQAWIINGNVGEWGVLTAEGYYLTRLFNGNIFEWQWPPDGKPGSDLTNLPPGSGGEDFGGSVTQARDGQVYVQAGKMGIWNLALTGLEQAVVIPGGKVTLTEADTKQALALREQALQAAAAGAKLTVPRATIAFTGALAADFHNKGIVDYQKNEDAHVRTALAYDDTTLYLGYEVRDSTPWVNGATDIAQCYSTGDTVDFQLGADPAADPKRGKAAKGDLRLAIANVAGQATAVLYKFVSDTKKPRTFTSGVVQGYQVDYVDVVADAVVKVKVEPGRYTVEVAVPQAALGVTLKPGLSLRGDVGVTHGDPTGGRTKLRTYWANQQTGLVDDVVFELQLTPQNWGELNFE